MISVAIARSCLGYYREDPDLVVADDEDITDRMIEEALEASRVSWEADLAYAMDRIGDAIHDSDLVGDRLRDG